MHLPTARRLVLPLAALASVLTTNVLAQTPAASTAAARREEAIQLSEFSVTEELDRGYVASETLTGSRVRTPIIDLPYTVNVLTNEYFKDFAMFELGDNITQIASFTGLDIGGGFQLRGFNSTSQLRDGFYRLGRYGSSNVDRLEVIKGSNAAIYGRTSPGGMVNMISKLPKDREYYELELNAGDYDTQRAVLELNGPVFQNRYGKTSYLLTLSQYQRGFDIPYARNHNQEYYLALKHRFDDKSSLTLQAEYFLQVRHAPNSPAPLITDQRGTADVRDDIAIGYARNLAEYNSFGPNSELNRGNTSFTATYEKPINDIWSARVAGSYFRARRWDYNQNTGFGSITINAPANAAGIVPAITSTRGATPNKGLIFEDGGGVQADVLAHYWAANHTIENRTLATIDFNDYYRYDPTWSYGVASNPDLAAWNAPNSGRVILLDSNFRPVAPLTYFPKSFQWGNEVLTRLTRRRTTVLGGLVRHQANFMQNKLLVFAGVRFDGVRFQERDYVNVIAGAPGQTFQRGEMIKKEITQTKPNLGANYKVAPHLRLYANYSESYFVNQTDNPDVFASPTYKPEIANGYDFGVKGDLLNSRLTFTVGGFYAVRENVNVQDTIETPLGSGNYVTLNRRDGNQLVRGFEMDVSWRASDDVSLIGSWGHVYSIYSDFGSGRPLAIGRRVNNVVPDNASVSGKWAPARGALKNFSANVSWTYMAATPSEGPESGDVYTDAAGRLVVVNGVPQLQRTTYQWRLRTPSFGLWNVGARYTIHAGPRFRHTLAVNVNNVFDRDYLRAGGSTARQLGERRAFYFSYTLGYLGGR
jgi:iron complex outermembrane recepter protein